MSSKQRRDVLSEEEYTSTLSSIVQREYFPELPALHKQLAVLDRREARDFKGAVAVRRAARRLQDHAEVLAEHEQEQELNVDDDNVRKTKRPLHRETVTAFHARVTSQDNHEFERNLQQEIRAKKSRIEAIYHNPYPALTNGAEEISSKTTLLTNSLSERDLMPPPASRQKGSDLNLLVVPKQALVEYTPKRTLEKSIEPTQTRFPTTAVVVPPRYMTTTLDDSSTDYSTEASTDLDSPEKPLDRERTARAKRQERELETLVAMTPLIEPRASPVTTWGTVNSTPMVLASSFAMPQENTRDKAAKAAEEKLVKRRAKATTPLLNRLASLTPAARSLLHTPSSARSSNALSNALRKSYTPRTQRSSSRDPAGRATPKTSGKGGSVIKQSTSAGHLTDDLLDLQG